MIRRVLRLIGPERGWIVLAALLAAVTTGSGIGLIATAAYLLSRAAVVGSTAALGLAITWVRLFAVLRATARYAERYVGHLGTFRIVTRIRTWVFRSLAPLGPAVLDDRRRGDLLTALSDDVDEMQDFYLRVAVPPLAAIVTTTIAAGVLGLLDVRLGLTLLGFLLVVGVVVPVLNRLAARRAAGRVVTDHARLRAELVEGTTGLRELVAYGAGDAWIARVAELDGLLIGHQRRLARVRAATNATLAALTAGGAIVTLALAIGTVRNGSLDPVLLAIVPLVAIAAVEAVAPLTSAAEHLERTRAAAARIFDLTDAPPEITEPLDPDDPAGSEVDISALTFAYGDHPPVLRDAQLRLEPGSTVVITGPSGAGKSTLASLLLRFREYHDGSIRLGGAELHDLATPIVRQHTTLVAQHDHLFDTTVRDNLLLGDQDADDEQLTEALSVVGLDGWVASLPAGLATRVGEHGDRLSGGERQRLMIARAVLRDADVLILDEATAHLDGPAERELFQRLRAHRAGRSMVVITHDPSAVVGADQIVELVDGRLTSVDG